MQRDVKQLTRTAIRVTGTDKMNELMDVPRNLRSIEELAPRDRNVVGPFGYVDGPVLRVRNRAMIHPDALGSPFAAAVQSDRVVGSNRGHLEREICDNDIGCINSQI